MPQGGSAPAINPAGKNEDSKDSNSTGTAVYDRGVSNPRHERLKSWLGVVKSIGLQQAHNRSSQRLRSSNYPLPRHNRYSPKLH